MKRFSILLLFFLVCFASAYNVEISLNSNVENFSTYVYKCTNSSCSQANFYTFVNSGSFVNKYILSGSGNDYYLEYDYKNCFTPHIYVNHVWDPYKSKENVSLFFSKKVGCKSQINNANISRKEIFLGDNLTVKANLRSAFSIPSGVPLNVFVPNNLIDIYSSGVFVELYANDSLVQRSFVKILFGRDAEITLNWKPNVSGNYDLVLKTRVDECSCESFEVLNYSLGRIIVKPKEEACVPRIVNTSWSEWANLTSCMPNNTLTQSRFRIEYDANNCGLINNRTFFEYRQVYCNYTNGTIVDREPPSSVRNLRVLNKSYNWILWIWDNPNESDFFTNIIYLNGNNKINTSLNYYNATNLSEDSLYMITINTMDTNFNINFTNVSDIQRTLKREAKNDTDEKNESDEVKPIRKKTSKSQRNVLENVPLFDSYDDKVFVENVSIELNSYNVSSLKRKDSSNYFFYLLFFVLLLVVLLLLYVLYLVTR